MLEFHNGIFWNALFVSNTLFCCKMSNPQCDSIYLVVKPLPALFRQFNQPFDHFSYLGLVCLPVTATCSNSGPHSKTFIRALAPS